MQEKPIPLIRWIKQTGCGCPYQWEGQLADGMWFYARGRWGYLNVCVGTTLETAVRGSVSIDAPEGERCEEVLSEEVDHLTTYDLIKMLGWRMDGNTVIHEMPPITFRNRLEGAGKES